MKLRLVVLGILAASPTLAQAQIKVALKIPAEFRGIWVEDGKTCKKRDSFHRAIVGKNSFAHRNAKFKISGALIQPNGSIIGYGSGRLGGTESVRVDVAMQLHSGGLVMKAYVGDLTMTFIRCSAVLGTETTIENAVDRL
jgi:hypothetical protein